MAKRILVVIWLLACCGFAFAAGPAAVRKQIEMSMLVTGMVLIEPDGSVSGWEIDKRDKLPEAVARLVEKSAPLWAFEPVMVDGQARRAKARMSLLVVANKLDDGNYRIAIRSGHFGEDAMDAKERKQLAGSDRLQSIDMRPPDYPQGALHTGVHGVVYLLLKIDPQGNVADAVVEQVNLRVLGSEAEMRTMRSLLSKPSTVAARKWRFQVPTAGEGAHQDYWVVRVPVEFSFADRARTRYGEWQAYIPGPRQTAPWAERDLDASQRPDALVAGQLYEVGKGLKLLTPLAGG